MKRNYALAVAAIFATLVFFAILFCSTQKTEPCPPVEKPILEQRMAFWDDWTVKCFPDQNWGNSVFITYGVDTTLFPKEHPKTWAEMRGVYRDSASANKYLSGIVISGSSYPVSKYANSGELLYKIVPHGRNIQGPSVYYVTKSQLDWIKTHPDELEQKLGLPLSSTSSEYWIYSITSKVDSNIFFESTIAPTEQYAKSTPKITYTTPGGATQSLIINNSDTLKWKKAITPLEKYMPNCLPAIKH